MRNLCVRSALVLAFLCPPVAGTADVMGDLDARLAEAVERRLEQRAREQLALPTGLPELPKDTSASVPAASAREDASTDLEQVAEDAPTRMRCQHDTYGLRCRVWPLGR